jgi:hypothetical protein
LILDQQERQIVSSLGWVEHGALLIWDIETDKARRIEIPDADYVLLVPGRDDAFAVVHHRRSGGYSVSVRQSSAPDDVLATAVVEAGRGRLEGDRYAWLTVPSSFSGYDPGTDRDAPYTLLLIDASAGTCEVQRMQWFNGDKYDLVWQGMGSPVEVSGEHVVLIPIQRSSEPVIYDFVSREVVGHVQLADRGGNPSLRFRASNELWADDYDTLLRLDRDGWSKRNELLLQPADDGVRHFIGGWAFDRSGSVCAVGRPFSGDVLGIDTQTFTVTKRAEIGEQPLDVVLLTDGRLYARDWKSGRLLRGELQAVESVDGTS